MLLGNILTCINKWGVNKLCTRNIKFVCSWSDNHMRMREQLYDCQAYENYQLVISRSARSGAAEFSDISFVSPSPTGQTASKRQSLKVAHSPLWSGALHLIPVIIYWWLAVLFLMGSLIRFCGGDRSFEDCLSHRSCFKIDCECR